jgi:hypothetical protein
MRKDRRRQRTAGRGGGGAGGGGGGGGRVAKGRRRGMYGDSESCDSTIKLGEFCSWRGVVPLACPPARPPAPSSFSLPGTAARRAHSLSFPPFRGYLRFDSPYLPGHPQTPAVYPRSSPRPVPRKLPPPLPSPSPRQPVKDSRIARPRIPASHLLLVIAISSDVGSIF